MYTVTVAGQYYKLLPDGKSRTLENFKEDFKIKRDDIEQALYLIQKFLINPRLKGKDPLCIKSRLCAIEDIQIDKGTEEKVGPKSIDEMSRADLQDYIIEKKFTAHINLSQFSSILEARKAVQSVEDNIEFLKKKEYDKAKEQEVRNELLELNNIKVETNSIEIKDLAEETPEEGEAEIKDLTEEK